MSIALTGVVNVEGTVLFGEPGMFVEPPFEAPVTPAVAPTTPSEDV